jgi:hypothetical protein
MGTDKTAAAFEAAFHDTDCQSLIQAIETFAASRSTTPGNIIDVLPCVHTGMVAIFARKEDEAKRLGNRAKQTNGAKREPCSNAVCASSFVHWSNRQTLNVRTANPPNPRRNLM